MRWVEPGGSGCGRIVLYWRLCCSPQEGFLYITGRKKEIIVTVSGEKVAPVPIENAIKHELPIISNAIVIGEQQKFLACLLTLRVGQVTNHVIM